MQIYYPSLQAIEQATMQLDLAPCAHCGKTHQLVSHGYIYKKQVGAEPLAVGKRVFCSNRTYHKGCGRTVQLYMDATVRYLHHGGGAVVAFLMSLVAGMSIERAYMHAADGASTPRNAYRWLDRLCAQLSSYRSLFHQPPLQDTPAGAAPKRPARLTALISTVAVLFRQFEAPLHAPYQLQSQRPFL